jgi:hypothetical protein
MSNATDKTDIKAWLKKASKAIYAATEAEAAEDISEGLSMARLRIIELETERDRLAEALDKAITQNERIALALREFEAERDKWKAAAEAHFTKSVL